MFEELIDISENDLLLPDSEILNILLYDHSSKKNIIWATDDYEKYGNGFKFDSEIIIDKITGNYGEIIKPRSKKTVEEKGKRIKDNAEVFTPSWVCNNQNNLVDEAWFGRKNIFNKDINKSWESIYDKITFPEDKTWQDYVNDLRLEIACGEGPYLTSRYDTVTGKTIKVKDRIGLLDRKLRVVSENVVDEIEWVTWAIKAMKSTYGYDWHGDNILLARENLLYTFVDYYKEKFKRKPDLGLLKKVAEIISWNIWQMDGIKFVIPNSCKNDKTIEYTLFGEEEHICECAGCKKNNNNLHNGIYCKIMNWDTNQKIKFVSLVNGK
ncbi:MAG: restriction endonuclease subunit M [Bacilli bacterium]|nr:restriction endonuclease subunit M [Bacilli bacterium]